MGDEHYHLALNLISFDEQLTPAMAYVFVGSLICSDMDAAKQVAFDPAVYCKALALDGHVFNPQGLLTGGSNKAGPSMLANMRLFADKQRAHEALQGEVAAREAELAAPREDGARAEDAAGPSAPK